ncbi:MAG: WG repeat-containing protein [Acetatifactor sp.]|nr:WG repeat-containing protein [Acetatifactor sp.]
MFLRRCLKRHKSLLYLMVFLILSQGLTGCGNLQKGSISGSDSDETVLDQSDRGIQDILEVGEKEAEYPQIVQTDFSWIDHVMESEGIYCVCEGDQYVFWTDEGELLTPVVYEQASPFHQGLACVCLDGKYGYIDTDGETVLECVYDYATPFVEGKAYFAIGETYGFMDPSGKPLFYLDCDSVSSFQEGMAYFSVDGKYGYIDKDGKVSIEAVYDDANYFREGYAVVRLGGYYGMIDRSGREVLPMVYDSIDQSEGFVLAYSDGMEYCFTPDMNGSMKEILCVKGNGNIFPSLQGVKCLFKFWQGGKWGLADADGNVLLNAEYDTIYPVEGDIEAAVVVMGEQYGLLNYEGEVLIPFGQYDFISSNSTEGSNLLYVTKDGKAGFLDAESFTEKIPLMYDQVVESFEGDRLYATVLLDDMYGVIDRKGNLVYPLKYERAQVYDNNYITLVKDGKLGLLNNNGKIVYQSTDDQQVYMRGECFEINLGSGGNVAYINKDGEQVPENQVYEYSRVPMYEQDHIYIAGRYVNEDEVIIKTAESETPVLEIDGAILKNAITPRNDVFYKIFLDRVGRGDTQVRSDTITGARCLFRFYRVDDVETILYYYEEPFYQEMFPYSESGFFRQEDGQAVEIVFGYECGGSSRGNYVTLWYDKENQDVYPGSYEVAGGFGGYAFGGDIYKNEQGQFTKINSFLCIEQTTGNYSDEELLAAPQLFYDENDEPCTANTILDRDTVTEYQVDNQRTTVEDYRTVEDRYVQLNCQLY